MINKALLEQMYGHSEWADALIWNIVMDTPALRESAEIKERLFHIHFTQKAYLLVWEKKPFVMQKSDEFASIDELYTYAREVIAEVNAFVAAQTDEALTEEVNIPWAKYFERQLGRPPASTTLGETLLQLCTHNIHHRGQLNTCLRQGGATPPLLEFIAWIWAGRPEPGWE